MTEKKGLLAAMKVVHEGDEIMIISEEGVVVRTPVKGISQLGRPAQGVRVMNVAEKDKVTAVAITNSGQRKKRDKSVEEPDTIVDVDENLEGLAEEDIDEMDE